MESYKALLEQLCIAIRCANHVILDDGLPQSVKDRSIVIARTLEDEVVAYFEDVPTLSADLRMNIVLCGSLKLMAYLKGQSGCLPDIRELHWDMIVNAYPAAHVAKMLQIMDNPVRSAGPIYLSAVNQDPSFLDLALAAAKDDTEVFNSGAFGQCFGIPNQAPEITSAFLQAIVKGQPGTMAHYALNAALDDMEYRLALLWLAGTEMPKAEAGMKRKVRAFIQKVSSNHGALEARRDLVSLSHALSDVAIIRRFIESLPQSDPQYL